MKVRIYGNDDGYLKNNDSSLQPSSDYSEGYLISRGQVYQATYGGELRLPSMYRSFISFSFGGEYIQDFGIIRVTEGQRMQSNLYTEFDDLTQEYDVLHGQFYWGTHLKPLVLQYLLSTDGMTQTQLDKFKECFKPGKIKQLIRAQHPNRGILARVQAPPVMNMLAFQGRQRKIIAGSVYDIPTTLYKGDIKVSFICDDPLWYAIKNLIGQRYLMSFNNGVVEQVRISQDQYSDSLPENNFYQYRWTDENGNRVPVMNSGDALKIILQDNIPSPNMIKIYDKLFLGDNITIQDRQYEVTLANNQKKEASVAALAAPLGGDNPPYAAVNRSRVGITYAPAIQRLDVRTRNVSLNGINNYAYLYYAGNAPSYPTLYFTIKPQLASTGIPYIIYPANRYAAEEGLVEKTYNSILLESQQKHEFRFTTPSAWNGYNQALYWFNKLAHAKDENGNEAGSSLQDVKTYIRDRVTHNGARAYALHIIEGYNLSDILTAGNKLNNIFNAMKGFIYNSSTNSCYSSTFSINSKNGICKGQMTYKNTNEQSFTQIENVGDMVRSTYLFLQETNYPLQETGTIEKWDDEKIQTHHCVHRISSDGLITNFGIEYKNMYY